MKVIMTVAVYGESPQRTLINGVFVVNEENQVEQIKEYLDALREVLMSNDKEWANVESPIRYLALELPILHMKVEEKRDGKWQPVAAEEVKA